MRKTFSQFLSIVLILMIGSVFIGCSQQEQPIPTEISATKLGSDAKARTGINEPKDGNIQYIIDPNAKPHRGRIQIQGNDMFPEVSYSWARDDAMPKYDALAELDRLFDDLTATQKSNRTQALQKAKNFINAGPYTKSGARIFRTFQNNNPNHNSQRIDIEIIEGTAFVVP